MQEEIPRTVTLNFTCDPDQGDDIASVIAMAGKVGLPPPAEILSSACSSLPTLHLFLVSSRPCLLRTHTRKSTRPHKHAPPGRLAHLWSTCRCVSLHCRSLTARHLPPQIHASEPEMCEYTLVWPTRLACPLSMHLNYDGVRRPRRSPESIHGPRVTLNLCSVQSNLLI